MENTWLINRKEIIRYLGYKSQEPDEIMLQEIVDCEQEFIKIVKPKYYYEVFELVREEDRLFTADMEFEFLGTSIKKHLLGCEKVAFSCLTLSEAVDHLIDQAQKEDMLHALIYDAIANAAVEEVRFRLEEDLKQQFSGEEVNWLFGIGYGDLPLTLQKPFLDKVKAANHIGLRANEKSILIPLKSVTGFVGIGKHPMVSSGCKQKACHVCLKRNECIYSKNEN